MSHWRMRVSVIRPLVTYQINISTSRSGPKKALEANRFKLQGCLFTRWFFTIGENAFQIAGKLTNNKQVLLRWLVGAVIRLRTCKGSS